MRRTQMLRRPALAAALAVAMTLTACSGGGTGSSSTADTAEFHIAWNAQPPTLDPLLTTATSTRDIIRNVYEPLLARDSAGEVHPVLASAYEVSEDGKVIDFTLREGVKFHDGSDLEADDVVASLERWIEKSTSGQQFFSEAKIASDAPGTVSITLPKAMYTAIELLSDPSAQITAIQPKEVVESAPEEGVEEFIGTGPYKLVEWKTDQFVQMEKFDGYVSPEGDASAMAGNKTASYDNLYYDFVPDPSTRLSGLQTGEYDAANAMPFDNIDQLEADENLTVNVGNNGYNGLIFNKKKGVMSDVNMRQAVLSALDMEAIQKGAFASTDFYDTNGALMPDGSSWYTEAGLEYFNKQDLGRTEEFLGKAGYKGEKIRIMTTREYEDHYNCAVVAAEQLNQAGIKAELVVTDWATLVQNRVEPDNYEIFVTGFSPVAVPTSNVFLAATWPGWTDDPAITKAMDSITFAADDAAATKGIDALQTAFYDYLPLVKFGDKSTITVVKSDVSGYEFMRGGGDIFYNVAPTG